MSLEPGAGPPDGRPERPALREALRLLRSARRGPPSEADVPAPSTFPMTPAARAALEQSGGKRGSRTFGARRRASEG